MGFFDAKSFNGEVFGKYVDTIPNTKRNELIKSRAIRQRPDLAQAMADQTGGNYITTPLMGRIIGSKPTNYDGVTNIDPKGTDTYTHSRVVVGRSNGWTEKDFSYDITGGTDFMEIVAMQISEYWDGIDQATLVCILNGVFRMTDAAGAAFVASHTNDVTAKINSEGVTGKMDGTTLNTTMQKACGDNKSRFSLAIMHSVVATNLENLKLLAYLKYTDENGLERDLAIATLNGRMVLVDDDMPVGEDLDTATYMITSDIAINADKTYYTRSGSEGAYVYTEVTNPVVSDISSYYEKTENGLPTYTTYVLGDGAIEFTDCGAKVPYEMDRDPAKNGGEDTLYSRQRKCFAPYGINFTKKFMQTLSPSDAELENGENWELVNNGQTGNAKKYLSGKAIPIARIISLG